jgi:hypothetical protein
MPKKIGSKIASRLLRIAGSKVKDNFIFVWLVTKSTLTVVLMALFVLSPLIAWPFLMGWPAPYCYVAYVLWISWIFGSLVLAGVIGYLRETAGEKR